MTPLEVAGAVFVVALLLVLIGDRLDSDPGDFLLVLGLLLAALIVPVAAVTWWVLWLTGST